MNESKDSEASLQIFSLIDEIICKETEPKNILNLLYALGNLLYSNEGNKSIAVDMGIVDNIKAINVDNNAEEAKVINGLKSYFGSLLK